MESRLPIAEAKARFAECIRRAEHGETIVLTRHGRPVARLGGLPPGSAEDAGPQAPDAEGLPPAGEVREQATDYGASPPAPRSAASRREALERLLAEAVWPRVPETLLDRGLAKREREEILGYGSGGV